MSDFDVFKSYCADWAHGVEIVCPLGVSGGHTEEVEIEKDSVGLAVAVLNPDTDRLISSEDYELIILDPDEDVIREQDDKERFAYFYEKRLSAFVAFGPQAGRWRFEVSSNGNSPLVLGVSIFKARSRVPGSPSGPPTFRCAACKATAKGLAMAIVAATTAAIGIAAIPHALIALVAAFLGIAGTAAAIAFISSVWGDTAKEIAEKLCKAVRLC
jgi:hypothetical protein